MANEELTLARRILRGTIDIPASGSPVTLGSLIDALIDTAIAAGYPVPVAAEDKNKVINFVFAPTGPINIGDAADLGGTVETIDNGEAYTEPATREMLDTTYIESQGAALTGVFCKVYIGSRRDTHQALPGNRNYEN